MPVDSKRVQAIFLTAVEQESPADRLAVLNRECGADSELRQRVEALLKANDEPASYLDRPAVASAPPVDTIDFPPIAERPGSRIGPYKLMEQIGEGGFGLVFVAEQHEPVKRKVALKVIKPGMDSRQVIARFEAERQALALMDHPNIAKVLDAGATESGRPYFVMELVRGIPMTEYCDQNQLSPKERLELFITVCQAIQHAHQKGIIHRDIKPSNVLVTSHDGKPVAKVIDFGIAKAIHQHLTERTIYTSFAQMVGTPLYMSPEQAEMSGLDIDTRSDIYSLGVLLYELLTGTTPLEKKRFAQAAYDEIRRIIREEEPPKPSTRLSESKDALPSIAAQRHMEPAKLSKLVRGDLDWITMKALEKDRTRRYETANGLARDIQRHLCDEPVEAGPPSAGYRLGKFLRRNRGSVLAAGLVLASLLAGTAASIWQAHRAEVAREEAVLNAHNANVERERAHQEKLIAQAVRDFLQSRLLGQADARAQANALLQAGKSSADAKLNPTIRELLDRAAAEMAPDRIEAQFPNQPLVQAEILATIGDAYAGIGQPDKAIPHLERAVALRTAILGGDHSDTLIARASLARGYQDAGKLPEAIRLFEEVRQTQLATRGPQHSDTLTTLTGLAGTYQAAGKLPEAIRLLEQVRDACVATLGADHKDTLAALHNLARAYLAAGNLPEAIRLFQQMCDIAAVKVGADHPDTLIARNNLAAAYQAAGKQSDAITQIKQVWQTQAAKLGAEHPDTLITLTNLAGAYQAAGNLPEAIRLFEQVRDGCVATHGAKHPDTLGALHNLARAYRAAGRPTDAVPLFEQVRDSMMVILGPDHPHTLITLNNLAESYQRTGRLTEAIQILEQVRKTQVAKLGADHPDTLVTLANLAGAFQSAGRIPEAIGLLEQVRDSAVAKLGIEHRDTLIILRNLGLAYQAAGRMADAEIVLRDYLSVLERKEPDGWMTFNAKSLLGVALMAQKKFQQAEPLLVGGYQGLKQRQDQLPGAFRGAVLVSAIERVVKLYDEWGKADEATKWREELDKVKASVPPPTKQK